MAVRNTPLRPAILAVLAAHPDGMQRRDCWQALTTTPDFQRLPYLTFQAALMRLWAEGLIVHERRGHYALATACLPPPAAPRTLAEAAGQLALFPTLPPPR